MNKRVVCKENGLQALAQPMSYENFAFHEGFKCPPGHETNKGYLVKYEEDELLTHKKWFSESEFNQLFTLEVENTEQQIEQEIQSKNLNAPRLTPDHIDSKIKAVEYILPRDVCKRDNGVEVFDAPLPLQTLTFCILTLENGFTVTGESACASPENFDAEIGKKIAYDNAREKIWLLEGYLLKENLHKKSSQVELQAGIDQLLTTRIPILDQIYDVCQAIEKCGASPELTDAVTKAGELRDPISKLVDQALKLGIGEGIVSVSYSDNGSDPTPDLPEFKNDDVKSFEPSCSTQACVGSSSSNDYQLNAKRDNAFLVAQLLSNNKISAELRKKAESKMDALLDELI